MKLLLTSIGFANKKVSDTFLTMLSKPAEQNRALIVAYAPTEEGKFFVNEAKKSIEAFGIKDIVVANMSDLVNVETLGNFDVVFMCGGNTFAILNKLRETGLDDFVISQTKAGTVYVGASAGSIIAGPNISIAGWGSEADPNEIDLKDLTSFRLVDFTIAPHFHEELRSEIDEFRKQATCEVFEITDDQAVIVNGADRMVI